MCAMQASFVVPSDAYKMDFVFSDAPGGENATYDNRGGYDYHLPVENSPVSTVMPRQGKLCCRLRTLWHVLCLF
jgi:hypothetical protein